MRFAVDVMSGDLGPEPIIRGAIDAVREYDARVLLVGDSDQINPLLENASAFSRNIDILPTTDFITMYEAPALAVRRRHSASVVLASKAVANQQVFGFFSPGNTGATLAAAIQYLGRLKGIKRPALGVPLPRRDGGITFLIDAGANVDCRPDWLIQFAIMGEIYTREIFGVINPKIGILSNGEEDGKGNEIIQDTFYKLKRLPFDFVGNVEGRDLFGDGKRVDVVVTDGLIGNIVLKTAEGVANSIIGQLKQGILESTIAKTAAVFLKPVFQKLKKKMDYAEYGGVPLLGINGIVIVGHGSSNARAVKNAIRVGYEAAHNDINAHIVENIKRFL